MSRRRTNRRRFLQGGGFDPARLSLLRASAGFVDPQWRQCLATLSASLTMVIVGTINGWTMTSLFHQASETADMPVSLTHEESAWVVSLTVHGSMFGSLVAAQLADWKGRKYCLLVCSTMFTVGWFIIYVATDVSMLYLARVILGIGVGITYVTSPMYVSEIADISIRGILSSITPANVFVGMLVTCYQGMSMTYTSLLMFLIVISFITILPNTFFPETPYFLVAKGKEQEACNSIAYYKGIVDPHTVEIELHALRAQARYELHQQSRSDLHSQSTSELHRPPKRKIHPRKRSKLHSRSRSNLNRQSSVDSGGSTDIDETYMDGCKYTCLTKLKLILQRSNRTALFIMLGLIMTKHLSGNFITTQHLQLILSEAEIVGDQYEGMIVIQLVRLLSTCITMFTADLFGRRILLILSTLGSSFALIFRAKYALESEYMFDAFIDSTRPVINLILCQVLFQIGLGTLPNVLLCELFPTKLRGFVGAIIVIFDGIIVLSVPKLYQVIIDRIGPYAIYTIFASSCFLAFMVLLIWMPETKGKTYQEIEALLVGEDLNSSNEEDKTDETDVHVI